MVVLPIALDQPFNAGVVQNKGLGLKMQLSSFTVDELADNIETVVQSDSIAANLKLHSAILRNKPQSAAERVSFWVDHVTKYGGGHLRTGAVELSAVQFFMHLRLCLCYTAGVAVCCGLLHVDNMEMYKTLLLQEGKEAETELRVRTVRSNIGSLKLYLTLTC